MLFAVLQLCSNSVLKLVIETRPCVLYTGFLSPCNSVIGEGYSMTVKYLTFKAGVFFPSGSFDSFRKLTKANICGAYLSPVTAEA